MVQLVASAAASAIVTNTVAAQTQDGRARQTGAAADAGGGWFADLLAELLQDAQPSQDGTQIPADPSQQTTTDASAATGQSPPDAWKSVGPPATTSNPPQTDKRARPAPSLPRATRTTGSPLGWPRWRSRSRPGRPNRRDLRRRTPSRRSCRVRAVKDSTPANAQPTDGTQNSSDPSQDASLLAALQSLAAQFAQAQTGTQPQTSQSTSDAAGATSATTPSNAQLAALLQTLQAEAAAMTGASPQSGTTTDPQQTAQTTGYGGDEHHADLRADEHRRRRARRSARRASRRCTSSRRR